jgi:hypothetical protein
LPSPRPPARSVPRYANNSTSAYCRTSLWCHTKHKRNYRGHRQHPHRSCRINRFCRPTPILVEAILVCTELL